MKIEGDIHSSRDGWKAFGIGAIHGALLYATSGTGNAEITLGRVALRSALNAASNQIPTVRIGRNFNISPSFAYGTNGVSAGLNFSGSVRIGDVSVGGSVSGLYNFTTTGTDGSGWESRLSYGAGFDNGNFHFIVYSTSYQTTNQTNQRVGGLDFGGANWNFKWENDWLFNSKGIFGDGGDRFRTHALQLSVRDFGFGVNLFTGEYQVDEDGKRLTTKGGGSSSDYIITPESSGYSLGAVYASYGRYRLGANSDTIRKGIQSWVHNRKWMDSPHFPLVNYLAKTKLYFRFGSNNRYSLW